MSTQQPIVNEHARRCQTAKRPVIHHRLSEMHNESGRSVERLSNRSYLGRAPFAANSLTSPSYADISGNVGKECIAAVVAQGRFASV